MRTPPVCRSRFVGLLISRDRAGSVRSTSAASVIPNASISSGLAFGSGKCKRVADATPSSEWHPRHCAASKIGYTVLVNEIVAGTWAASRGTMAIAAIEIAVMQGTVFRPFPTRRIGSRRSAVMLPSRTERHSWRRPRLPRHHARWMSIAEPGEPFLSDLGLADIEAAQIGQLGQTR